MRPRQVIGLIGSIILIIGVFAPMVSIPIVGEMNYFQNGKGDGLFVLLLGLVSMLLVLGKNYIWLWLTSIITLAILTLDYFTFTQRMEQASADLKSQLGNNPFSNIAEAALQTVQLEWGMPLLLVGAFFLIACALMNDEIDDVVENHDNTNTAIVKKKQRLIIPIGVPIIIILVFLNIVYRMNQEKELSYTSDSSSTGGSSENSYVGKDSKKESDTGSNRPNPATKASGPKNIVTDEEAF